MNSAESVERAIAELNKQELDGRALIIEVAKPADQKEKKERKFKRKPGRRGSKAVPGELTEAEANGEAPKAIEDAPASGEDAAKPKKKKKANVSVSILCATLHVLNSCDIASPRSARPAKRAP